MLYVLLKLTKIQQFLPIQRTLIITTVFVPLDYAVKKNVAKKNPNIVRYDKWEKARLFSIFTLKNVSCGYLLEQPHWDNPNIYPWHFFLEYLIPYYWLSPYQSLLELRIFPIQTVAIMSFVVISNVSIKGVNSTCINCEWVNEPKLSLTCSLRNRSSIKENIAKFLLSFPRKHTV